MRQTMLSFGQRPPSATELPATSASASNTATGSGRLQGRKSQPSQGSSSSSSQSKKAPRLSQPVQTTARNDDIAQASATASASTAPAVHSFFAKRERVIDLTNEDQPTSVLANGAHTDDRPSQKRRVETPFTKFRVRRPVPRDALWPGQGESHVQPDASQERQVTNGMHCSLSLEKRRLEKSTGKEPRSDVWPWTNSDLSSNPSELDLPTPQDNTANVIALVDSPAYQARCTSDGVNMSQAIEMAIHALKGNERDKAKVLWTDRWRPRSAQSVLGNEMQAVYMREWMRALQVTAAGSSDRATPERGALASDASPRRKVIKRVQKRRGRISRPGEFDDFLVDDEEEEQAWFEQFRKASPTKSPKKSPRKAALMDEDDLDTPFKGKPALKGVDEYDLDFASETHLTNLILLVGPHGSGKTASVYACALELGFEVFELFPGMGKRSGKDIISIAGDLGRNHMVSGGGSGGGAFQKSAAARAETFFKAKSGAVHAEGLEQTAIPSPFASSVSKPRQSLILFEEVDVLFEDDKGFWASLVELLGTSQRPVVLTCNDLNMVPLDTLPLQRILFFTPPSVAIAAPYLQVVAAYEGDALPLEHVEEMYARRTVATEALRENEELLIKDDGPMHEASSLNLSDVRPDLRQAMMQLQFAGQRFVQPASPDESIGKDDTTHCRPCFAAAEARSFADAHLTRPYSRAVEMLEMDHVSVSVDDVQETAPLLLKPTLRGDEQTLASYGRESEFRDTLWTATRSHLDDMPDAAVYHQQRLAGSQAVDVVLSELEITPTSHIPSHEAVLDYAPMVAKMVGVDDAEEEAHRAHIAQIIEDAGTAQRQEAGGMSSNGSAWNDSGAGRGARVNRQSTRILLQRSTDGSLTLGRREPDFSRMLTLRDETLTEARKIAPNWHDE